MTNDDSGGEPASFPPGVTSTLTPEEINWVSHHEVDRLTRWHFGWTLLGSVGGIFLSAGLCHLLSTESGSLSGLAKLLLGAGGFFLLVSWAGFWLQVWWRKRNQPRRRPVEEIKLADTTGGSTS